MRAQFEQRSRQAAGALGVADAKQLLGKLCGTPVPGPEDESKHEVRVAAGAPGAGRGWEPPRRALFAEIGQGIGRGSLELEGHSGAISGPATAFRPILPATGRGEKHDIGRLLHAHRAPSR